MKIKIYLFVYVIVGNNCDWIKLHHFTPTQLNIVKSDPVSTVISRPVSENNYIKNFGNESIATGSLTDIVESKLVSQDPQPLLFESNVKDSLLRTYWALSQPDDGTLRGKLIFLQKVKQHLLHGIWEQSQTLWNKKTEARSMLGFPSMEGALVTIAFLTFAVFLIKIVQQFVQGLQGISPNTVGFQLPPTMTTSGSARHKRHFATNEAVAKIFQYMDEFKIHHEL